MGSVINVAMSLVVYLSASLQPPVPLPIEDPYMQQQAADYERARLTHSDHEPQWRSATRGETPNTTFGTFFVPSSSGIVQANARITPIVMGRHHYRLVCLFTTDDGRVIDSTGPAIELSRGATATVYCRADIGSAYSYVVEVTVQVTDD